ncbi:MAG: UvrB/UvrC motif-containing protein [Planctomycetota bacterium]
MKCDHCDEEATVHETTVANGQIIKQHLCERHANELGLVTTSSTAAGPSPMATVSVQKPAQGLRCPECELSYAAFRQHGLLGCSSCYGTFADKLSPLIERAHQGGTHHIGKTPRRLLAIAQGGDAGAVERVLGGAAERAERAAQLRRQLDEALAMEQYERAAALRDELRRLDGGTSDEDDPREVDSGGPPA